MKKEENTRREAHAKQRQAEWTSEMPNTQSLKAIKRFSKIKSAWPNSNMTNQTEISIRLNASSLKMKAG